MIPPSRPIPCHRERTYVKNGWTTVENQLNLALTSSTMAYFFNPGTYRMVPTGMRGLPCRTAAEIGSAYVPVPPATGRAGVG